MSTPRHNERRAIFITGAASGVGRQTALLFAREGWLVGAYDVNAARLDALRDDLAGSCVTGVLDVADRAQYARTIDQFGAASGGRLDLLFNNAGIARGGPLDQMLFDDVLAVINVNLLGVIHGMYLAAPLLKATPNSLCFSMSSATGVFGLPNMAIYAATKHAVKGLTEALSLELRPFGVRVADAMPGLLDTPFIRRSIAEHADRAGMLRVLSAQDMAEVVWKAYHSDQLHWYVPDQLQELARSVADSAEDVREQVASKSGPFAWMRSIA
jgi:NAD(P)-dependent dehydrogenase (short-subunit alcohol dehydrogenase family)